MSILNMPDGLPCGFYRRGAQQDAHQARRLKMVKRLVRACEGSALDYGCGYGDIAHAVAPVFTKVTGVDVSEQRIEWAREEFPNVHFEQCKPFGLDFPDNSFQTVLSIVVINWVDDPEQYLSECFRVLAPGGRLVLAAAAPDRIRSFLRRILQKTPPSSLHWSESLELFKKRLSHHGFIVEQTDCFYEPWSVSVSSWKACCHTLLSLPMRLFCSASFAPYYGLRAVVRTSSKEQLSTSSVGVVKITSKEGLS